METEQYQQELFEFEKSKSPQSKLAPMFPKNKFSVTLTLEKIVFLVIGIIMLLIAFYALGVDKGRSYYRQSGTAVKKQAAVVARTKVTQAQAVQRPVAANTIAKPQTVQSPVQVRYTVVAAIFTKKDTAVAEMNRLKLSGYDAYVAQSNSYVVVCVGYYPSKDAAQRILSKLKGQYKDAYITLR